MNFVGREDSLARRAAAGGVAGLAGSLAMNLVDRASPAGHGAQTKKEAETTFGEHGIDPAEKAVAEILPATRNNLWSTATLAQYAFGAACGAVSA